jgi:uncharacterized SAM-binding protein YcdF (DUF218 family)
MNMFFILSKTLYYLVLPSTWLFASFIYFLFSKNEKWKKRLRWIVVLFIFFFSNAFIINEVFLLWELPPTPFASIKQGQYEVAIVLTGVTSDYKSPKDRIYFHRGADRVLHTVRLFQEGKVKRILVSGAEFSRDGELSSTDRSLKQVFLQCGVPDSAIWVENQSRNTYENAIFSAKMIEKYLPNARDLLLVSSAFHLRRAEACFKKAGVEVDVFSTDFYAGDGGLDEIGIVSLVEIFMPSLDAWLKWNILIKEVLGYVVYKFMGYA